MISAVKGLKEVMILHAFIADITYFLTSLLNCVPCVLKTCSRANVPYVLTCSRAKVPCELTCSHANVLFVLMCSRANVLVLMPLFSVSLPLLLKLYTLLVRFKSLITVFPQ